MSKTLCRPAAGLVALLFLVAGPVLGADATAKFLGANSCASTGCHGGGGQNQNQFLVWSLKDFHSHRPPATLTTARSKQIADALDIKDATADARCTTCHAPLQAVPENLRGEDFKVSEGVSCESCHGPAENWLRSHTRKDYTRADRTALGMRDLQNLYVRANSCVACHQNVDHDILKAGHPELIFELDGQSVAEPKHWIETTNWNGAPAWLVGQAVALREMSWQLSQGKLTDTNAFKRWEGLMLICSQASMTVSKHLVQSEAYQLFPPERRFSTKEQEIADQQFCGDNLARLVTGMEWTSAITRELLETLTSKKSQFEFVQSDWSIQTKARRAERLVLALDRLVAALPEFKNNEQMQSSLNRLFKLAQNIPDFDPKQFADALQKFSAAINPN